MIDPAARIIPGAELRIKYVNKMTDPAAARATPSWESHMELLSTPTGHPIAPDMKMEAPVSAVPPASGRLKINHTNTFKTDVAVTRVPSAHTTLTVGPYRPRYPHVVSTDMAEDGAHHTITAYRPRVIAPPATNTDAIAYSMTHHMWSAGRYIRLKL